MEISEDNLECSERYYFLKISCLKFGGENAEILPSSACLCATERKQLNDAI